MIDAKSTVLERHREAIRGLEKRVERDEANGLDTAIVRIVLMQHYAAYAIAMVQKTGGGVAEMQTLTDRHNVVPLAGAEINVKATD